MNEALSEFSRKREEVNNKRIEDGAESTLRYYNKIIYMIAADEYEHAVSYLYSVQQFIEEKEYITPSQMEAVDRIFDENAIIDYDKPPF